MTPTPRPNGRGWFITIEGPEGSGKTSQAERLLAAGRAAGVPVALVREPGGTPVGERIRSLLLNADPASVPIGPRADALLFNAARAQLVADVIEPKLAIGWLVISIRFSDSTLAYQGYGAGLPLDDLRSLERFATGGLRPDRTILLDLPVEIGLARKRGVEETRFESTFAVTFHRRVREGFLALAAAAPDRFVVLDATRSPEAVAADVRAAVQGITGPWSRWGHGAGSRATSKEDSTGGPTDAIGGPFGGAPGQRALETSEPAGHRERIHR
ncbi:MAG TPA: dTMP kinase [Candidatus Saccharimonadales bacterium]|nr:dTMP kinase [Candidatus Saccharimonadales bacterium]